MTLMRFSRAATLTLMGGLVNGSTSASFMGATVVMDGRASSARVRGGEGEFRRYKIWGGEKRITSAADHLAFCDTNSFSRNRLCQPGQGGAGRVSSRYKSACGVTIPLESAPCALDALDCKGVRSRVSRAAAFCCGKCVGRTQGRTECVRTFHAFHTSRLAVRFIRYAPEFDARRSLGVAWKGSGLGY